MPWQQLGEVEFTSPPFRSSQWSTSGINLAVQLPLVSSSHRFCQTCQHAGSTAGLQGLEQASSGGRIVSPVLLIRWVLPLRSLVSRALRPCGTSMWSATLFSVALRLDAFGSPLFAARWPRLRLHKAWHLQRHAWEGAPWKVVGRWSWPLAYLAQLLFLPPCPPLSCSVPRRWTVVKRHSQVLDSISSLYRRVSHLEGALGVDVPLRE